MQAPGPSRMQRRSPGATEPGPPPNVPVRSISPGVGMNPQMRSSTASSRSAQSSSSRRGKDSTGSANMPLSQIEKSVTHLLVATKQLLETLTQWSRGQATDGQVSDVYVRLGYEFNMACRAFSAINVDTSDLGNVPELLRNILESTLSQEASTESLEKYLPRIRDIIINLLHGLKRKQQKLRQKQARDREAGASSSAPERTSARGAGYEPSPVRAPSRIAEEISTSDLPPRSGMVDSPTAKTPEDKYPKPSATLNGPLPSDLPDLPPYSPEKEKTEPVPTSVLDKEQPPLPREVKTPEKKRAENFLQEASPPLTKDLTLFLQYKSKVKKFVLPEGYSDLSIGRLQLAFIEKFSWNTHSNGADLPDIYIQDPVSGVRHELEDLSDIKDRTVLVLNIEALDEVKRHVDEGIGSLKQIIQDVKQGMSDQSIALQLVSERQQETATELARLAAAPPTIVQTAEGSKATAVASGRKLTPGHLTELQILRRDLAVMRQTYSNFQSEIQGSMTAIRAKASNVKAATINASVPHINGDGGYTYVSKGREQLNQDSDRLVTKVDDLQDTVEDLRKDVVHRGVRPLPRQLEGVAKDITRLTMELKKELEDVCKGRDELRLMEDLMVDLQDDLEKASETFALVEAATKEQLKDNGTGARASSARSRPDAQHEDRLEAIERAEKLRQRELATRNTNKLQQELTNFVEEGRLKKSGGFEEVERARTAKDERIRREVWERQNGLIMDDFGDEEFDEDEEFEGEEGAEEAGDEQLLEDVNGDEAAVDTPPSPPPAEAAAPVVNGNVS
ncbi:bud site selection protein [Verticillium alfalfae VaMs.102]|uniref:Bud site selection protein n=1 Tax=Verticillium alfalfae (strain VaMs.102 / ATCC MYA-4576 / FGSC 10136) TaxID=526221 RepID=C9SKQ7_VERA1|nr:bud site selection protein [Verticillium alfalfae VaMs.102]EEY19275.1 bud site selection protein [Verticillium alfalfae VaMs.102]